MKLKNYRDNLERTISSRLKENDYKYLKQLASVKEIKISAYVREIIEETLCHKKNQQEEEK